MQKSKTGKFSIFSPLGAKLGSLAGRVGLTQFPVESRRVGLKMWATRLDLGSGSKCQPETRPDGQSRLMIEWKRVQRTMKILKWLGDAARSLAQNVSVGTSTVSVGLSTCVLARLCSTSHDNIEEMLTFI